MDRLTVQHEFDPETGFIVAKEVVPLPAALRDAPRLDAAIEAAAERGDTVIVFATADRCAPCQQFKQDALNDLRVLARLDRPGIIATHIEVDQNPGLADTYLGSRGIPVSYALRNGQQIATLPGQRSAQELINWLDSLPVE